MMNPQMVNQGWNSNVNRFSLVDPAQLDYLVPFKQFYEYTKRTATRRIDDDEMQKRFGHYKEKFAARQLAQFFVANKEKEWFQEKYHPTLSRPRYEDIKTRRRRYLSEFLVELEKGDYDAVCYDKDGSAATPSNEQDDPDAAIDSIEDDNTEYESRLVIKTVPPTIAREKIMEVKTHWFYEEFVIDCYYRCVVKSRDLII
jgi:hypothetical protein